MLAIATVLLGSGAALGGDLVIASSARRPEILGTLSCSSTSCHGQIEPQPAAASTHGQAYHLWLAHDPHARAGLRIVQPRFQEVLRRASQRADGGVDPSVFDQCAKCHDPIGMAETNALTLTLSQGARGHSLGRGIGCETCHGPASQWIAKHYEQGVSREDLRELGMVDTKDVVVRAKLCAACHVGSAEHDVTHDMLAAGHPPLRFEMIAHQALIQRKHWDDSLRGRAQPDYEVQLWGAGRIAAADSALALLERRARNAATDETQIRTDKGKAVWPELAEHNCFACHQSLRPADSSRALRVVTTRAPGVPAWQHWNFACVPSRSTEYDAALDRLRAELEGSFSPSPKNIARLAAEAQAALPRDRRDITASDVFEAITNRRGEFTWDRACHELAALNALERSLRKRGQPLEMPSLRPAADRIAQSLSFPDSRFEWPAVFIKPVSGASMPTDTMSLDEIAVELNSMAAELRKHFDVPSTEY